MDWMRKESESKRVFPLIWWSGMTLLMVSVAEFMLPGSAARAAEEESAKFPVKPGYATQWKVDGYFQGRLTEEEDEPMEFLVRKARLKVQAQFAQEASFMLQLAADEGKTAVKDAVILYHLPGGLTLEMGQRKWNVSYEVLRSSSLRGMPERSAVVRTLFAGTRDRGIMVQGTTPGSHPVHWSAGLWNGNGINDEDREANDFKDLVVYASNRPDVEYPYQGPPQLNWQLYAYLGRARQLMADRNGEETPGRDRPKQRLGLGLQYHYDPIPEGNIYTWREGSAVKGEFIWGKGYATDPQHTAQTWQDVSAWGFWLQETHNLSAEDDIVVRYDRFDPDDADSVEAWGITWIRHLGEVTRGSLTWEQEREGGTNTDRLTAILQFKY